MSTECRNNTFQEHLKSNSIVLGALGQAQNKTKHRRIAKVSVVRHERKKTFKFDLDGSSFFVPI